MEVGWAGISFGKYNSHTAEYEAVVLAETEVRKSFLRYRNSGEKYVQKMGRHLLTSPVPTRIPMVTERLECTQKEEATNLKGTFLRISVVVVTIIIIIIINIINNLYNSTHLVSHSRGLLSPWLWNLFVPVPTRTQLPGKHTALLPSR